MAERLKFAVALAALPVVGISMQAFAEVVPTVYESFNGPTPGSDAYWLGNGNRSSASNNYGWSALDKTGTSVNALGHAASGPGELGGNIQRGNFSDYGFDTGAMSHTDVLHADGVYNWDEGSGSWFFGFYNESGTNNDHMTAGGDPRNFIGIQLDDSRAVFLHNARSDGNDRTHTGPQQLPQDTTIRWSMDYNGAGQTTFVVNGVSVPHNSGAGYFTGGSGPATVFNRFGLFPVSISDQSGVFAMDDITFSSHNAIPEPPSGSVWINNGDGDWFAPTNWAGGVPNSIGAEATFATIISADRLVYANSAATVGKITFNDNNTYLVTGLGSLTLSVSTGSALVDVKQGTHKINLPLTVASNTTLQVANGTTLLISDPVNISASRSLSETGAGTVTYQSTLTLGSGASLSMRSSQHIALLNVGASATATIASSSGDKVLRTAALVMNSTGKLNLTDNDLIVDGGNYATLQGRVIAGYNNGNWNGNGITSSTAATNASLFALGIADNDDLNNTEFSGATGLDGDEILVKFTYVGDANLTGGVNLDDFNQFLFGFNPANAAPQIWLNGNFNYDTSINLDDFNLFLFGLANQGGTLVSPEVFAALSEFVTAESIDVDLSQVPEPSALGLLALAGGSLLRRGRRRDLL